MPSIVFLIDLAVFHPSVDTVAQGRIVFKKDTRPGCGHREAGWASIVTELLSQKAIRWPSLPWPAIEIASR